MQRESINILLVEDNPGDARLIREMVSGAVRPSMQVAQAESLAGALDAVKRDPYDLILLDLGLPDAVGKDSYARMKAGVADIPVVVLTGLEDEDTALDLIKQGAQDYVSKTGLNGVLLQRVIRYSIERSVVNRRMLKGEKQLRDSELRFRTVWDTVETAIMLIDEETHTVSDANPAACSMLKRQKKDVVGRKCHAFICTNREGECPISDLGLHVDAAQRDLVDAEGVVHTVLKTVTPVVLDGRGYLMESFVDISERKRGEELQKLTSDVLMLLNESFEKIDFIARITGVIRKGLAVDAVGIRLQDGDDYPYYETNGFPAEFVVGERNLCGPGAGPGVPLECMCGAVISGTVNAKKPWFTPGGSFWSGDLPRFAAETRDDGHVPELRNGCMGAGYRSVVLVPLRSGVGIIGLLQLCDRRGERFNYETVMYLESIAISIGIALARAQVEKEKVEMQKQLLHAQKMEAVGTLAGGVAHDFNNILTIIQGTTDLMLMDHDEDSPEFDDLRQIQKASDRAADLTRQLLVFSRKQHMELAPVSLNNSVHEMLKMLARVIGENIEVNMDLAAGLPQVLADPLGIEQLLMNLTMNARDAMPEGGTLFIRTQLEVFDRRRSETVNFAKPGEFVCLSVTDTGTGMDEATVAHVFDPFFTTKEQGKGTGLGLSVVYGIVKQHGGWVNLFSEPGHGSTFRVYFPVIKTGGKAFRPAGAAVTDDLKGAGQRILLVEDEEGVRDVARSMLQMNGYRVTEAPDCATGEALFVAGGPFDLVFSDVVLTDGNGVDMADRLRAREPDVCILLCSGYIGNQLKLASIRDKGYPFLAKPFSADDLLRKVKGCLGKTNATADGDGDGDDEGII